MLPQNHENIVIIYVTPLEEKFPGNMIWLFDGTCIAWGGGGVWDFRRLILKAVSPSDVKLIVSAEIRQQYPQSCAGILKQSMETRNRVEIALSYRPARLHSLAELVPWNRFSGSLKV